MPTKVAILGSGNIGTDLMIKVLRHSKGLELAAMAGIDPASDGLARAARFGIATTADGVDGLVRMPQFADIAIVFDATSAGAHHRHNEVLQRHGKQIIDLTPAAIGPYIVPPVNFDALQNVPNVNMITCGGQATIPIVAAISRVARVPYAEIVASIASKSAGPGTRANIDEFTETTSRGLERVGGAERGKAIIVLNPAEPPLIMRNTVFCLAVDGDARAITDSINRMAREVQSYVPGYRLKQDVQFEELTGARPTPIERVGVFTHGLKVSVFLEIEGAGHYLPKYAGNLDIMTSAALRTGERLAAISASRSAMAAGPVA
jgi:acetaldehyde dehydrogenase